MDYTKLPRYFIFKDRKDLDDFPVKMQFGFQSMESVYLEALEQRPFIRESYEAPELILEIFNNARYITTLICLESHPNHYFRKYLRIAGSNDRSITIANHAMPATMALVKNYLCHYMPNLYSGSKIIENITENFNTVAWKEHTLGGCDDFNKLVIEGNFNQPGWTTDTNFEPRDIREAIDNPLITVCDISENIDYILESLEKSVEIFDEEIAPLNAMYKKLESWFSSDLDDNLHKEIALDKIEKRLKKLDPNNAFEFFNIMNDMEKSLYNGTPMPSKTKDEIDKYMKKTLGVGIDEIEVASSSDQTDDEKEEMKALVEKLETENKQLQEQLSLKDKTDSVEDVDALKAEIESLKSQLLEAKESEWIACFDSIFHRSLNPQAIAEALEAMTSLHLPKNERSFWWVFYVVLSELKWIVETANQNTILQWANLHFNMGWDWRSDQLFKFTIDKKYRIKHSSKWSGIGTAQGQYYSELADTMRDAFVKVIDGVTFDRKKFILPGMESDTPNKKITNK